MEELLVARRFLYRTRLPLELKIMGLRAKFNLVILAAFAVGLLIAAIVVNGLFVDNARAQVLQNARIMMTAGLGEEGVEVYIKPGKDEISSLSVAFHRMRESLRHAMEMIK